MKLYFSDVDNTLVVKGAKLSTEMKKAIKKVQDNGDEFVLCSGRPLSNLIQVALELRDENIMVNYVAGFNGGQIYDLNLEKLIVENGFTLDQVEKSAEILELHNVDYLMYDQDSIVTYNVENEYAKHEAMLTGLPLKSATKKVKSAKLLGLVKPEEMDEKLPLIKEGLSDLTVTNSTPFFIEITPNGVDKGYGLEAMRKHLEVEMKDTYCFGDALNDYAMFEICPNGYAVENAVNEIKEIAKGSIPSVEENGVAQFIESIY